MSHIHFAAIRGVMLDKAEYIRTETFTDNWCIHMQDLDTVPLVYRQARFCHVCGAEKPSSRTWDYEDHTGLPQALQDAIQPALDRLKAEYGPSEGAFSCLFEDGDHQLPNGLSLIRLPNDMRLFVGEKFCMMGREDIEHVRLGIFEQDPHAFAAKLRALGISRKPELHLLNFWW